MLSNHSHHLQELKNRVIHVAGFKSITPADCKIISGLVSKKTRCNISPTTIKRIYGFAHSEFNPSIFTLDALAKYCDYSGWAGFCEKPLNGDNNNLPGTITWDAVKQNADKVTLYTLRVLKNKSGIPFNCTIKRKFINDHFEAFLGGDYNATALIAPAGYGKTIALCHWVDELLVSNLKQKKNDIILLLSGNVLVNNFSSGLNLNDWILSLLGYNGKGDIVSLLDNEQKEGKFFMVIDAFDAFLFKNAHFQLLIDEVVSIISLYKAHTWFKVILTMRSATWINNKHIFINGQSNWFRGFFSIGSRPVNVPLFDIEDIRELCAKIAPEKTHDVNIDVVNVLRNPLYFQFYYQSHADNFCVQKIDQVSMHELISSYVFNKIYLGPHATEKLLLIQGLVEAIDFINKNYVIDKLKVYTLVKCYQSAYNDMISHGYLRELNTSNDQRFDNHIEFSNSYFLGHAVAQIFLLKSDYQFNENLIATINSLLSDNHHKLFLLKWCVMYAVKNGQYENLKHIAQTTLQATEKAELLLFMKDLFEKEFLHVPHTIEKQFGSNSSSKLFEYFFGIEFINTDYEQSLKTLLKFKLTEERKISVYTSLAIVAIIQMDLKNLEGYLLKLNEFSPDDFQDFPLNPLMCLEAIYAYLKHGIIKKATFAKLTKFYFNPPAPGNRSGTNDVIYLLALYTLSIGDNPVKTLRVINAINKAYPITNQHAKGYNFLLRLVQTEAYFLLYKNAKGLKIYNEVLKEFDHEKSTYTPFMKALFYLLKIKVLIFTKPTPAILQAIKPLVTLADDSAYKLIKIQCLALMLTNPQMFIKDPGYYKTIYYDFIKTIRESGFREKSFIKNDELAIVQSAVML